MIVFPHFYNTRECTTSNGLVTAVYSAPCFTRETQTAGIVSTPLERFAQSFFFLAFSDVFVVEIPLFQVPDRWPAMMSQMSLIVRMKRLEDFRCFTA